MPVPEISVVIPLFNEEATLVELVERIVATMRARAQTFEIVCVDDGSRDSTPSLLAALAATNPGLRVLTMSRNFGQAAALCCGIFAAQGEVVVTMDGDLQNPPEEIPRLLDALTPGVDVVTARRAVRHESAWRLVGSRAVHWIARALVGGTIRDFGGQFKAYRRVAVDATRTAWAPGKPFFALSIWLGFRAVEVSVRHEPRRVGASRYRFASLVRLNLDIITSFTTVPLALLGVLALITGGAGTLGILVCVATGHTRGFAAALSLLLFGLGGVNAAAAALGVYLARLYRTLSGAPMGYVLRPTETVAASGQRPVGSDLAARRGS